MYEVWHQSHKTSLKVTYQSMQSKLPIMIEKLLFKVLSLSDVWWQWNTFLVHNRTTTTTLPSGTSFIFFSTLRPFLWKREWFFLEEIKIVAGFCRFQHLLLKKYKSTKILSSHSGPDNLKKSSKKNSSNQINQFHETFFWPNFIFCNFKNGQNQFLNWEKV